MKRFGIDKIQLVWWWSYPRFKWWAFPTRYKEYGAMQGQPIFWGLYLGIFEIRFFPVMNFQSPSGIEEKE